MNKYLVKITRYWEREVEAENAEEARELVYEGIEDCDGYDFDEVEIDCLDDEVGGVV